MNTIIQTKDTFLPHLLMTLYAIAWNITLEVGVRIYGAEILSILGVILLNWRTVLNRYPMSIQILKVYAIWMIAIVLSDLWNATDLIDCLRNLGTPIMGGISFIFILLTFSKNLNSL